MLFPAKCISSEALWAKLKDLPSPLNAMWDAKKQNDNIKINHISLVFYMVARK